MNHLQTYKTNLKNYIQEQSDLLTNIIDQQDISNYQYEKRIDKTSGTQDAHYQNRLTLSTLLLFSFSHLQSLKLEEYLRLLFKEEMKDRQSNSFQGIGECLNILTYLLLQYKREDDIVLFNEVKNANFDCYLGYNFEELKESPLPLIIDQYDDEDCLHLAKLLNLEALSYMIMTHKIQTINEMSYNEIERLRYHYRSLAYHKGELFVLSVLVQRSQLEKSLKDHCYIQVSYLEKLVEMKKFDEAKKIITMLQKQMLELSQDWYTSNPGKHFIEYIFDVILNVSDEMLKKELWIWSYPYVKKISNMHGNLMKKAAEVARYFGEVAYADEIEEVWKKKMGL